MTTIPTLHRWQSLTNLDIIFQVNDCLQVTVTDRDLWCADDPEEFMYRAVLPLVWMTMPVHDDPAPKSQS